jgi:hypothetical protein
LEKVIGRKFRVERAGHRFDVIPLPHPSGASPWHKIAPGKELLGRALKLIARNPAVAAKAASAHGGHKRHVCFSANGAAHLSLGQRPRKKSVPKNKR